MDAVNKKWLKQRIREARRGYKTACGRANEKDTTQTAYLDFRRDNLVWTKRRVRELGMK